MKILAVSDTVVERLYSPRVGEYFSNTDLVLGCGDLPYGYLEFLVSSLNIPLYYVPGNHDPQHNPYNPTSRAEGCENIDLRVIRAKGLTIAGLGGSHRYQPGRGNQYSQKGMYGRVLTLLPSLLWQRLCTGRPADIIIAHSPPRGVHDDDDIPHHGFSAFGFLLRLIKPRFFLHGHTMAYKNNLVSPVTQLGPTTVINVYPYRMIEVDGDA
jgi:Icc-related predicted phosphoesterase